MKQEIYDSGFVTALFDEMSATYGTVNLISSFGFCVFWRKDCAKMIQFRKGDTVLDLMSGMAELSVAISKKHRGINFIAVDLSPEMCRLAADSVVKNGLDSCEVLQADALNLPLEDNSVDSVVSTFGLKTFSPKQLHRLASEAHRVVKPGGSIAFLEISVPTSAFLRAFYMFYLNRVIPLLGRLFMGNPDNYRYLGIYTTAFESCESSVEIFRKAGFELESKRFFFGCASGFHGRKME